MGTAQRNAMLFPGGDYWQRVVRTAPANLISYWPLWDASGTGVVNLASLRGMPAAVGIPAAESSNVTLAQPGIGDGKTAMLFNGTSSYVNIYSAELASAFNGAEGTLLVWTKVTNADVWADGTVRRLATLSTDGQNHIHLYKLATGELTFVRRGSNLNRYTSTAVHTAVGWLSIGCAWSIAGNYLLIYVNGVSAGSASTCAGAWVGALAADTTVIGSAAVAIPERVWGGYSQHVALWNTPLSAAQIAYLSRVR